MIARKLQPTITNALNHGKAIIIMGPRQVGKSTLLKQLFGARQDVLWLNGDEPDVPAIFDQATSIRLKAFIGNRKVVIVDEAQRISDIGLKLKLIIDNISDVQLVASGSSSFELSNKINEPLTGRKFEYQLFPLSFGEMVDDTDLLTEKRMLKHRMVYGYYPDVVTSSGLEREVLANLTSSYLYKDILSLDRVQKSEQLVRLLQCLAFQVGSQVSYNELAIHVGLDAKTVERYISILEKCFIIFRLMSFSRNVRNELRKSRKIYFYDNGVRNAIIGNYSPLETRLSNEIGALWENFAIAERVKKNIYDRTFCNQWFWRTKAQQEIDYIEESDGKISAFEFKWNPKKVVRVPQSFASAYPGSSFCSITPENIEDFLL
ncbi:MAG: ATP-binding protein [Muribaculaceae bacterium]|nr:ATP-binding protein [Muribaculaceae bacterium]